MSDKKNKKNQGGFTKNPLKSVGGRFALIISIAIIGCLLIIEIVSFVTMRNIVTKSGQEKLSMACDKVQSVLDEDYSRMLYISQAMTSSGVAGKLFDSYSSSKNIKDYVNSSEELNDTMSRLLFTAGDAFAVYYDVRSGINHLDKIQKLKDGGLSEDYLPILYKTSSIDYHAIHDSRNKLGKPQSVSISRRNVSFVNPNVIAYVEIPFDATTTLKKIGDSSETHYLLVQLDDHGTVKYSSDTRIEYDADLSILINSDERFGEYEDLMWYVSESQYGFFTVVLQPASEFYQGVYSAANLLIWGALISVLLIAVVLTLLDRLVIRKNAVMLREIERVGSGNLDHIEASTGLQDYDELIDQFNRMLSHIKRLIKDVEQKERQRSELERETLYYQINPHFLLNALNSAFWLSKTGAQLQLDDYLSQLTGILRYSLGKDNQTPTFRKELEVMKQYLKLQQYRHDFNYSLDIEEGEYLEKKVPRLFIQPVIENSIEHGMDEGGELHINVLKDKGYAKVIVTDNGTGVPQEVIDAICNPDSETDDKLGIGLRYVRTMLRSQFGSDAYIELENVDGQTGNGTKVVIGFPIEE